MFFENPFGIQVVDLEESLNAIVKRAFREAGVEIWVFPFRKGFFEGGLGGLWAPGGPVAL